MARPHQLDDLGAKDPGTINQGHDCKTFKYCAVKMNWFHHNVSDNDYLNNIANTPGIVIVNKTHY